MSICRNLVWQLPEIELDFVIYVRIGNGWKFNENSSSIQYKYYLDI